MHSPLLARLRDQPSHLETGPDYNEIATIAGGRDITRPFIDPLGELILPQDEILLLNGGLGWRRLELYEKVRQDDQVASCLQQRFTAITQSEWEVLPGQRRGSEVSEADEHAADFIREQLADNCDFDGVSHKASWGVFYGYSVAEMLYARDGQYAVLNADKGGIRVRDRKRFQFDVYGRPRLITPTGIWGEELPPGKFWCFNTGTDHSDDPYGLGLGHWLYWPVWFKRNDLKFWLFFLEKFGQPTAVGKYRAGTPKTDQDKLMLALFSILTDAGIILPEGMSIELLEASRSGTADYSAVYERMDAAISKICLSQTMTTDSGSSRSQAEVHAGVAEHVVKSDADLLCSSFNAGPIRWLVDYNRAALGDCAYPKVWRRIEQSEDVDARADREPKLYQVGYSLSPAQHEATYGEGYQYVGTDSDRALITNLFAQVSAGALPRENAAILITLLLPHLAEQLIPTLPQPAVIEADPTAPTLPLESAVEVQATALNGAQIKSLVELTQVVSLGQLPLDTAVALITIAIPSVDETRARALLSPTVGFTPAPEPGAEPEPVLPPAPDPELRAGLETADAYTARLQQQALFAPLVGRLREELRRVIADGGSLEDFRGHLDRAYSDLDTEALETALAQALAASRLAGIYEAQEGE